MMKKKVYLLITSLLFVLSACDTTPKFQVNGIVSDAENKTLYFEASSLNGIELLDSVELGKTGNFDFTGNRPESPEFYRLRMDGKVINFAVDSTETVQISASANNFSTNYQIEGSVNNQKIKELVLMQAKLQKEVNDLIANTSLLPQLAQQNLNAAIENYKQKVKKDYIFKSPNTSYAYFALFQTINGYMVFDPLTSKDDVKCFAAVATSLNNAYPHANRSRNLYNMVIKGMKNTRTPQQKVVDLPKDMIKEASIIDIALKDESGKEQRLTSLKGKVVLLDFTVFNNAMSATHNLALRDLYNKYHEQGLEIYQISLDPNEHFWKTSADNLPWVCVRDPQGIYSNYANLYGVSNLPSLFLVNRDNELILRGKNDTDWEKEIKKHL